MACSDQNAWVTAQTERGTLALDPALGNIRRLAFLCGDRRIAPLHAAPWLDDADILNDPSLLPVERRLSGDFFCAPFGASDVTDAPAHGWTANSEWEGLEARPGALSMRLKREVMGATVSKSLNLSDDAPLLYQEHLIDGGDGGLTVAHHPMVRLSGRGRFSCSPKRIVLTPATALDAGRNALALGARVPSITTVPAAEGGTIDLRDLPIAAAHEDFVTLVEAPGARLGWSALLREAEDDMVFVLKDPRVLPVTMLWHSNGGRDYAPWNGRHRGVLGIEDGCAAGADGHAAALGPNPVADEGVATALTLAPGRTHRIAHVIGAMPRPNGWRQVVDIALEGARLVVTGDTGGRVEMVFRAGFFDRAE
ncbi:MAG: hypothetical protein AAFQ79_15820 [Pseudomonadota bacterium]